MVFCGGWVTFGGAEVRFRVPEQLLDTGVLVILGFSHAGPSLSSRPRKFCLASPLTQTAREVLGGRLRTGHSRTYRRLVSSADVRLMHHRCHLFYRQHF